MFSINTRKNLLLGGMLVLLCATPLFGQEENGNTRLLYDFSDPDVAKTWRTVNDGVMGGVSEGEVRVTEDKTLEFFGTLSLENNGGFTSVRSPSGKLDVSDSDAIVIRVRGDGRTYYANVYVPTERYSVSYRTEFTTEEDEWQDIRLSFADFKANFRGRNLPNAPSLDLSNIQSMGFLLSDKKAGPFSLEMAWIKGELKSDE